MPLPKEPFKIFISHATVGDGGLACWIADALDRLHIRSFVYERYQRGGQNRFEVIKEMIAACPYFLVLLTRDGIASQWVNQEIGYAVAVGKEPIPVVEVDSTTGKRIESRGFVELHDPIPYYPNENVRLIAQIIYTLYCLLNNEKKWDDLFFLSCQCGNDFDGYLGFEKHWYTWISKPEPFAWAWCCPNCQQLVGISFPDCHLLPQED